MTAEVGATPRWRLTHPASCAGPRRLVAVARNGLLGDALIFDRGLEHHAVGELVHQGALDLLPRRLAFRERIAALLLQRLPARRELRVGDQHIGGAAVEIDAHPVAGLEER